MQNMVFLEGNNINEKIKTETKSRQYAESQIPSCYSRGGIL